MRVDPVRNYVIIALIGAALVTSIVLDVTRTACRPTAMRGGTPCPIPADGISPAKHALFCTGRLPVNEATAEELMLIRGIGPSRARAIVELRDRNGPFRGPEDLLEVRGIGPATLERLEPLLEW